MNNYDLSKKFKIINEDKINNKNNMCQKTETNELIKYYSASIPDMHNIKLYNNENICYVESKNNVQKVNYDEPFSTKIWYNHYRGYIVKSYLDPLTNRIVEEKIKYNQN